MEGQQFCLRWHNFQNTLLSSLPKLLDGGYLTDVTLSAGGRHIHAHKIILSACSYYFKELFKVLDAFFKLLNIFFFYLLFFLLNLINKNYMNQLLGFKFFATSCNCITRNGICKFMCTCHIYV